MNIWFSIYSSIYTSQEWNSKASSQQFNLFFTSPTTSSLHGTNTFFPCTSTWLHNQTNFNQAKASSWSLLEECLNLLLEGCCPAKCSSLTPVKHTWTNQGLQMHQKLPGSSVGAEGWPSMSRFGHPHIKSMTLNSKCSFHLHLPPPRDLADSQQMDVLRCVTLETFVNHITRTARAYHKDAPMLLFRFFSRPCSPSGWNTTNKSSSTIFLLAIDFSFPPAN